MIDLLMNLVQVHSSDKYKFTNKDVEEGLREAKIKTARKSLEQGLEVELISKITDLSIDEIQKIEQLMISEGDSF